MFLLLNGNQGIITELWPRNKSLGCVPDLGRQFIFSFQVSEISPGIEKRIASFINNILQANDNLILISPTRICQLPGTVNKESIFTQVKNILIEDFVQFGTIKNSRETHLENSIKKLQRMYQQNMEIPGPFVHTIHFLNTYPGEFLHYVNSYLLPPTEKLQSANNLLGTREGERWLIHFIEFQTLHLVEKTRQVADQIENYIHSQDWNNQALRQTITALHSQFKNQISRPEPFPESPLLDTLMEGDISLNTVFFNQNDNVASDQIAAVISNFTDSWRKISRLSGGIAMDFNNIDAEIQAIKKHRDHYFDLTFEFDGPVDDKSVSLKWAKSNKAAIYHRQEFSRSEIEKFIHYQNSQKIRLEDFLSAANKIGFKVSSFKLQNGSEGKFGIIKVRIDLYDRDQQLVFNSQKTLRAREETLDITILIPTNLDGEFFLMITIVDMIGNSHNHYNRLVFIR